MKTRSSRRGFTLVEIMIAASIGVVVIGGALGFMIQVLRTYQYETGKLLANRDIRKFTLDLTDTATYSNYFLMFPTYSSLSRTGFTLNVSSDPKQGYTTVLTDTSITSGNAGDCLVFIYKNATDDTKIARFVVYYRVTTTSSASSPNEIVALKKLIVDIPSAAQGYGVWRLLPAITSSTVATTLFTEVQGKTVGVDGADADTDPDPTGKLFYNYYDRSVMIRGLIYENYTSQRRVKNIYNFTVSPRG